MNQIVNINEQPDLFGNIVASTPSIDRDSLYPVLRDIFRNTSLDGFVGMMTNPYTETLEYLDLLNGKNACQKTSLLFNPHRLDTRSNSSKHSIFSGLQTDSFCSGLARATLFKKDKVRDLLYQVIQLGINGVQYINEFPPHIARSIALGYNISSSSKVLDPCAGWGGRMIGISTICNNYICFEPSTRTSEGLTNLAVFIKKFRAEFNARVNTLPFEDSHLTEVYDFALTSPPYYDTEIYTDEETNSLNRYDTFDKWVSGFFIPMISKTMDALKDGCSFVLNIGSRQYPLSDILMDNFSSKYTIVNKGNLLSGNAGLGKSGDGETFYEIIK